MLVSRLKLVVSLTLYFLVFWEYNFKGNKLLVSRLKQAY